MYSKTDGWSKISTRQLGGVKSPPVKTVLISTFRMISDSNPNVHQVDEERGRERTRLPPARGGGGKEEESTRGVEVEKARVEKEETTSEQPAKPPAAPRRKKK